MSLNVWKRVACLVLRRAWQGEPRSPEEIKRDEITRILIVRPHDDLEDLLLATPVFRTLRQGFPEAHIALLTRADWLPFVEHNVHLDEVIGVKGGLGPGVLVFGRRRLRPAYDLAVVLNTESRVVASDVWAYLSGAPLVLGPEQPEAAECGESVRYPLAAPYSPLNKHDSDRQLDIVRHIGLDTDQLHEEIHLSPETRQSAFEFLAENGIQPDDFVLALDLSPKPGSVRLPLTAWVHVARHFGSAYKAKIVVRWEPQDGGLATEFMNSLPFQPIVLNDLSRLEQTAVFYYGNLFVTYDTIGMHLAAGVGTPLVAIFAASDPYHRKPIGPQFMALRGEEGDSTLIETDQIIELGERLVRAYPKAARWKADGFDISERVLESYLDTLSTFEE